jgi:hypothetical protein
MKDIGLVAQRFITRIGGKLEGGDAEGAIRLAHAFKDFMEAARASRRFRVGDPPKPLAGENGGD